MKYILTDIEGTTTSINFVHDTLFPYSYKQMENFVYANIELTAKDIKSVTETVKIEEQKDIDLNEAINFLKQWIKADRKHPALKNIQGHIWKIGYESGEIKGHVYADVPSELAKWRDQGIDLGIYSSGSVLAQKLLFGHSQYGNLNDLFSHNFDTEVGHKRESQSYQNILTKINVKAEDVLFLSDIAEELKAAESCGLKVIQLVRDNNTDISNKYLKVKDFKEISRFLL